MELVGQRFGHIRITEVVGQGGMGDVYAAYDEKLERKVAVKALAPEQRLDEEARERLLREARALSRLDHPNICRIHDYIESNDADLLVLEFIDGRTLGEVMQTPLSRGERLRIASAIAGVLVTAHRAGIVHRDLKPDNVMLTKFDEVKVLDFGLARWLQRTRTPTSRVSVTGMQAVNGPSYDTAAPLETAVGITLGTPIYMSPEQARGESLTPASDMYSFGLLLQALFTGSDPHPLGLSARQVILRAARGETNPIVGVPRDVTALIERLKNFAPADRPTAVEAVERLEHLIEKPQRIARRAFAAALVAVLAFGGWRYTVDLQTERAKAVEAQGEAERRRGQAEDLIEFMLGDLHRKLGSVGRLDVLDDVANRALMYVSSLDPEVMSAEELARNSKALNQVGDVRIGQGNVAEALRVFEKSLQLSGVALRKAPNAPNVQLAYATSHFWVGNAHRLKGDLPRALQHMRAYQQGTTKLAREHPHNDEYLLEGAYGHDVVGTVLEASGNLEEARNEYRRVLDIQTARLQRDPVNPDRQHDVAFARNKLGYAQQRLGDREGALANFRAESETYRRLSERFPKNTRWKDRLANSLSYLSTFRAEEGATGEAMQYRLQEQALWGELVQHDSKNAQWQRNLATTHLYIGSLLRQQGDFAGAQQRLASTRALIEPLALRDPERATWQVDLAFTDVELARVQLASGGAALATAQSAVTRLERLVATDSRARLYLSWALLVLGEAQEKSGRRADAQRAWEKVLELTESLVPNSLPASDQRIRALIYLGRTGEARANMQALRARGYRNPDLERLGAARGVA